MKQRLANAVSKEIQRRKGLLAWLFAKQLDVVKHPAKWKAVLTPRRAGKTEMICTWLLDDAVKTPEAKFLYVALTRPSAEDIAWGMFKKLYRKFNVGDVAKDFHESKLNIRIPNGSLILIRGADQPQWVERLEGQAFKNICIDESGLYNINMRKLVYSSFLPMLTDWGDESSICLIGRPGDVKNGLFYDITRPDEECREPGWQVFTWTTFDNPYMAEKWRKEINALVQANPGVVHEPWFRRHYLGEWCDEVEGNVYTFSRDRNIIPTQWIPFANPQYGLGLDFGWKDSTAICICAWSNESPDFVVVETFKKTKMGILDIVQKIEEYRQKYPGLRAWGDSGNKQLFMEIATRFGEIVQPADKQEKRVYIELFNADLAMGKIRIIEETNKMYLEEIESLKKFFSKDGEWKEHPKQANDCCDTVLYVWRHSQHFRHKPRRVEPVVGTPDYYNRMADEMERKEMEKMAERKRRQQWSGRRYF